MTHTETERAAPADSEALDRLRHEFPGWWFGRSHKNVGWDAKRRRGAFWTGGIWALEATSPELLRELLLEVQIIDAKHAAARS
ncbi:hypothetical protein F8568_036760 [Actinomadura sp. LD22]|uniref:Uncharacterized protein n=1 Tax=Actinomadura physcomitrii TaxID=2650748 RepID=A0A6I4MNW2_9ACTN|nr:hypothetical protein [Actinomadura physcomitrii]MWA05814.1 hypothetical protein [Actinomadura physcomitrii]